MIEGVLIRTISEREITRLEPSNVVKVPGKFMEGVAKFSLKNIDDKQTLTKEIFSEPTVEVSPGLATMDEIKNNIEILEASLTTPPGEIMRAQTEEKIALYEKQLKELKSEARAKKNAEKQKKIETLELTLGTPYGKLMHEEILKELEKMEKEKEA